MDEAGSRPHVLRRHTNTSASCDVVSVGRASCTAVSAARSRREPREICAVRGGEIAPPPIDRFSELHHQPCTPRIAAVVVETNMLSRAFRRLGGHFPRLLCCGAIEYLKVGLQGVCHLSASPMFPKGGSVNTPQVS